MHQCSFVSKICGKQVLCPFVYTCTMLVSLCPCIHQYCVPVTLLAPVCFPCVPECTSMVSLCPCLHQYSVPVSLNSPVVCPSVPACTSIVSLCPYMHQNCVPAFLQAPLLCPCIPACTSILQEGQLTQWTNLSHLVILEPLLGKDKRTRGVINPILARGSRIT